MEVYSKYWIFSVLFQLFHLCCYFHYVTREIMEISNFIFLVLCSKYCSQYFILQFFFKFYLYLERWEKRWALSLVMWVSHRMQNFWSGMELWGILQRLQADATKPKLFRDIRIMRIFPGIIGSVNPSKISIGRLKYLAFIWEKSAKTELQKTQRNSITFYSHVSLKPSCRVWTYWAQFGICSIG